jgi:hypothetical protein
MHKETFKIFIAYSFLYLIAFSFLGCYLLERFSLVDQVDHHAEGVLVQSRFYFLVIPAGFLLAHWLILLGGLISKLHFLKTHKEKVMLAGLVAALIIGIWIEALVHSMLAKEQYTECIKKQHFSIYTTTHIYYRDNSLCDP